MSESGKRCSATRRLEFDHIEPRARGGETTVENLRLRCKVHNHYAAECVFGAEYMKIRRQAAAEASAKGTQAAAGT